MGGRGRRHWLGHDDMDVRIARELLDELIQQAAETPTREVCGLLFGAPDKIHAVQSCENVAADPTRHFELDPSALIAAHRAARASGAAIMGCYHSHPEGLAVPSSTDLAMAEPNGWVWLIIAGPRVEAWRAVSSSKFEVATLDIV
jgi:desampylase